MTFGVRGIACWRLSRRARVRLAWSRESLRQSRKAQWDVATVVLCQSFDESQLRGNVKPDPLRDDERDLVFESQVTNIQHRDIYGSALDSERYRSALNGGLGGQEPECFGWDLLQILAAGQRCTKLVGERLYQELLADEAQLQKARTQPATQLLLTLNGLLELTGGDPASIEQDLTERAQE